MKLRCLIGHDYGDLETTETREERENERVLTVKEYRECRRCGHRTVVSENTEVRSIEPADTEQSAPEPTESPPEPTSSADYDDGQETFDDVTAEEDDGVILDDEASEAERAHGEWPPDADEEDESNAEDEPMEEWPDDHEPEADFEEDTESVEWPEHDADDEGFDAEPGSGDPVDNVEFSGSLTPKRTDDSTDDTDAANDIVEAGEPATPGEHATERTDNSGTDSPATDIQRSGASPSPSAEQPSVSPDATFECPQCGFQTRVLGSSLRSGDICPECKRGYLAETES